ncbi:hypothetical protein V6N11_058708 [Hibiscus sabdariffa]|uniref:Uncharacterized protein n=1 Tax=Hibiscus sabdariffa TaxID=183260 RepID=A0ABR2U515_9ROSI
MWQTLSLFRRKCPHLPSQSTSRHLPLPPTPKVQQTLTQQLHLPNPREAHLPLQKPRVVMLQHQLLHHQRRTLHHHLPIPPKPLHSTSYSYAANSSKSRLGKEFITESKVFQTSLLQFLHNNFPAQSAESPPSPHAPPASPAAASFVATPSTRAGEKEEVHYSSNAEPVTFDWHTPYETQPLSPPTPTSVPAPPADITESSRAQKRKAPAARVIREDTPLDPPANSPAAADPPAQPTPTKRQQHLHIILSDSEGDEDNNEDGSDDPATSRSLESAMAAILFTKYDQFSCVNLLIAGCKGAVLGLHHMVKKRILHFEERMIRGFCETMWVNPLEVPGNMLPETGSRRTLLQARGACSRLKTQNLPRQQKQAPTELPAEDKPVTQQDALPKSEDILVTRCLSQGIPFVILLEQIIKALA